MNTLTIDAPSISVSTKQTLLKQITLLDNKINNALISPNTLTHVTLTTIEQELLRVESQFREMEVELSPFPKKIKDKYDLPFLKNKVIKLRNNYIELESHCDSKLFENADESKQKLLTTNNTVHRSNLKMAESIKIIRQVNDQDRSTMQSLQTQSNTMLNMTSILNEADVYVKNTSKVLSSMINRALRNKLLLICIIVVLGLINVYLVYYKINNKFK